MEIFKLIGSVFIDTNEAEQSLSKVDEKAEKTGVNIAGMAGKFGKAALGVGAAAVGIGAAMVTAANGAAGVADEIDKGSKRMGVSTDAFQELKYAAGQCGVEMSTLEKAAKKLEGTDLSLDQAIEQIMALGTEEERSAAASELFGDSIAYTLGPVLAETGDSFQDLRDRAHDLGLVMSEDMVDAGVKMGDSMADIKMGFEAIGTQIAASFMPIIQAVLDWILAHMPEIQAAVNTAITFIMDLINSLTPLIEAIVPIVEKVFSAIGQLWETSLKPILEGIITFLTGVFTGNWEQAWQGVSSIFEGIVNGLTGIFKGAINGIISLVNGFTSHLGTIQIPDWVPAFLGGGKSLSFPQIPYLAKGGTIQTGGEVVVGEAGPELLNLPSGATVTPLKSGLEEKMDRILTLMEKYMPEIGSDIVLDSGALVGQTVAAYDEALGRRQARRNRGL